MDNLILFRKEEEIIKKFSNIIDSTVSKNGKDEALRELLHEYRLLLEQTKRLIKMSDRIEFRLNQVLRSKSEMSNIDFLTEIYNRRFLNEALAKEWKTCERDNTCLSMLMLDVDYFKSYNDTYGHIEGDYCLQMIATEIKNMVKRPRDIVARYGGEEFVALLPGTDFKGAKNLAENLKSSIEKLARPHKGSEKYGIVTVSAGISSIIPKRTINPEWLIEKADEALYKAKENGRNSVC